MSKHPYLRPQDIEALTKLLERDLQYHPHTLSKQGVAMWMDADERFARWVEEHQPGLAEVAHAYRKIDHERTP